MQEGVAPKQLGGIKVSKVFYPIAIGVAVVGYMMYRNFDAAIFGMVDFSWTTLLWILIAILCMMGRDLGYVIRLKVISEGAMSWMQALRVIMLWEFTSAITPSAVGGTSVAVIYVHKEGISVGRSSAMVLLTSFLDELYFVVMFPLMISIVGWDNLFSSASQGGLLSQSLVAFALIGYSLKTLYTILIAYGLFRNPKGIKWLFVKVFSIRPLRRWKDAAERAGDEVIEGSKQMKVHTAGYWFKVLASTFLSWSSRYFVANALIMALFSVSDHLLLFVRQLVMWVMMLVMPTPGGSGFAEEIFSNYCFDMINIDPSMQAVAVTLIVLLWRLITYYPYLMIGAFLFPRWIRRNFIKGANPQTEKN